LRYWIDVSVGAETGYHATAAAYSSDLRAKPEGLKKI
jgi:hypothetical protein